MIALAGGGCGWLTPSVIGCALMRITAGVFAATQSAQMKKRLAQCLISTQCPQCDGKRLRREALWVTFDGLDIGTLSRRPLHEVAQLLHPAADGKRNDTAKHPEQVIAAQRIAADLRARIEVVQEVGLGYLSLERSTPTLSPGELQGLRLATQIRWQSFGVVHVMDEPSAGSHPADAQALLGALDQLKVTGNSVVEVEHKVDVIRHADWIVDVGPAAGVHGGKVLNSGPPAGLEHVEVSTTRRYLFSTPPQVHSHARNASGCLQLRGYLDASAARAGGCGQHGDRGRARYARGRQQRLGAGHGARDRRCVRTGCCGRHAGGCCVVSWQPDCAVSCGADPFNDVGRS